MSVEEKQKETEGRCKKHGKVNAMADTVMIPTWDADEEARDEVRIWSICGKQVEGHESPLCMLTGLAVAR
jgi:hypothetical protein